MNKHNRAEGWKYAKLFGHKNENIVSKKIIEDFNFRKNPYLSF